MSSQTDNDGETQTELDTETAGGEPQVTILDSELVVDDTGYSTDVYVAATVTNEGGVPTGQVELTADWYDEAGNFLDNDQTFLQSLGAGETWAARVYHLGTDSEEVDTYEFEGSFETDPPKTNPSGLEVVSTDMKIGDREVLIEGRVSNERDGPVPYVQATGKIYDEEGILLDDEWTNVTDIPEGETWAFELTWRGRDRVDQAASSELWITDTAV
jgi:hypothetical protein